MKDFKVKILNIQTDIRKYKAGMKFSIFIQIQTIKYSDAIMLKLTGEI